MGGSGNFLQSLFGGPLGKAEEVASSVTPPASAPASGPPAVPTPENSSAALDAAAAKQRQARGSLANRLYKNSGSNPLSSGNPTTQRMLLGS